jgi:hypothetical protein
MNPAPSAPSRPSWLPSSVWILACFLSISLPSLFLPLPGSALAAPLQNPYGKPIANPTEADRALQAYLQTETETLEARALEDIRSGSDFLKSKEERRQQLREMLGLDPLPSRTELHATVTGTLGKSGVVVEKLHFQSLPGLYVTANLYRPEAQTGPLPAILYVCGHGAEKIKGVSYGNKVHYQHWGAWFARNGYVCLMLDTVQLGEIEGIHHGTYNKGLWWWNSRGFTSAGIEAWNGIRALDYLESRPEVNKTALGVTGRSGGGAYAWWIAALDDRIRAACPTAGLTDLRNHVLDSCVEGHCDCMYPINTYRWDFAQVAALLAPRPLLICNTDKDPIFPIEGVHRVYLKTRRIYDLLQVPRQIGLVITEGLHQDTQEIQLPVLRWFNKWLKKDELPVQNFAEPLFTHEQLKVFSTLPSDEITSRAHETFTQIAPEGPPPALEKTLELLRAKTFAAWPRLASPPKVRALPPSPPASPSTAPILKTWAFESLGNSQAILREAPSTPKEPTAGSTAAPADLHLILEENGKTYHPSQIPPGSREIHFTPIGSGAAGLGGNLKDQNALRRKLMLVGTTLASLQAYEVTRALEAIRQLPDFSGKIHLHAPESLTEVATFAALFSPRLAGLHLEVAPRPDKQAADFLNWSRILTPAQLLELTRKNCPVSLQPPASLPPTSSKP